MRGADVEAVHKLGFEFNCKINLGLNLTVDWGRFNAGPLARDPRCALCLGSPAIPITYRVVFDHHPPQSKVVAFRPKSGNKSNKDIWGYGRMGMLRHMIIVA